MALRLGYPVSQVLTREINVVHPNISPGSETEPVYAWQTSVVTVQSRAQLTLKPAFPKRGVKPNVTNTGHVSVEALPIPIRGVGV